MRRKWKTDMSSSESYPALPAGEYVVHYVTDDSHCFGQWNQEAPFEPERWGITIRPGSGFDRASFERR